MCGRDTLDAEGLERLIEHVIAGGVHGIFVLGTTGEAPSLSYRVRREMVRRTCEQVRGRVPVVVGITDTAFTESVSLAEIAAGHGAAGVVLATPYYFPAGQAELIEYVEDIVPQLPLPVMLYNMPGCTKLWFEIETLRALTALDGIMGVKDSSGDIEYYKKVLELKGERSDWSVLIGPEHLMVESVVLGGDGGISGGANVFPRLFTDAYAAVASGDMAGAATLQARIMELQKLYDIGQYTSRFIKGTKCALSVLGICDDFMAEPFHRFHTEERERVREIVDAFVVP
jgi:4-hydroxy-tetrahydrodipicolinate synthase